MLNLIKLYYRIISILAPRLAAQSAFTIFQKVRKKSIRNREKDFFENGIISKIKFKNEDLNLIEHGQQNKDIVLLVHGWDSNAGCMSAITEMLLKKHKHIISFNLPSHANYKSNTTNLQECQLAFQTILAQIPNSKKLSIISHSFGSAVTAYALSKTKRKIDNLVFLTSPDKIIDIFSDFKSLISLGETSYKLFLNKAENVIKEKIENIEVSEKLTHCAFDQLLIFHDINDKIIPFSNSFRIHSKINNSKLFQYKSIGHYRMLWNKKLIEDLKKSFN